MCYDKVSLQIASRCVSFVYSPCVDRMTSACEEMQQETGKMAGMSDKVSRMISELGVASPQQDRVQSIESNRYWVSSQSMAVFKYTLWLC